MIYNIGKCPNCQTTIEVICDDENLPQYFTADCDKCNTLVLYDHEEVLDFHAVMNKDNPSWPKDGKGTMSIEL